MPPAHLDRISKLNLMLIREVTLSYQPTPEHTSLLTTLLYLLQFNIRTSPNSLTAKAQFSDMVNLNLQIFNFVKAQMRKDQFIIQV